MDLDVMREMMAAETSAIVRLWMNWMMLIFISSLAFVAKFKAARWTFLAIIGTIVLALITWTVTKNIHLFGIPHLLIWIPLAVYLWRSTLSPTARLNMPPIKGAYSKAHMVWVSLLFITILISLVFDVRDVALVANGTK